MRKPGACLDCPNSRSTIHLDRQNGVAPEVGTASGNSTGSLRKEDDLKSLWAEIQESQRSGLPWSARSQGKTGRWTASKGTSLPADGPFARVVPSLGFMQRRQGAKKNQAQMLRKLIATGVHSRFHLSIRSRCMVAIPTCDHSRWTETKNLNSQGSAAGRCTSPRHPDLGRSQDPVHRESPACPAGPASREWWEDHR